MCSFLWLSNIPLCASTILSAESLHRRYGTEWSWLCPAQPGLGEQAAGHIRPTDGSFADLGWRVSRHTISNLTASFVSTQADIQVEQNRQHFYELSLEYVCKLQETQERKKFEFVEPVSINSIRLSVSRMSWSRTGICFFRGLTYGCYRPWCINMTQML